MIVPDEYVTTREVTTWKGLHLLHFQSSSCSQKVRVLLREKDLDWVSHPVDLPRQKHVSRWYLGINPCLLYTSPSPRDGLLSRMPSSA